MDLEQEYLRSLDGSSIAVWRFFEERFDAAFAAVRQSELIFEFDDFPADAEFSVRATAVATAAIEGMALLDAPSDEYLSAVSTLYKVSELALLWDSLLSETESGQGELLARAILLTKSIAYDEASDFVRDKQFFEKIRELELDRASRSAGGLKRHANHEARMAPVLETARSLLAKNPTLSNDDLAHKLKLSGGKAANLTTPTLTKWLRRWRREGNLSQ